MMGPGQERLSNYWQININIVYLQCDGFVGYEITFKTNSDVRLLNCLVYIQGHFELALDENR